MRDGKMDWFWNNGNLITLVGGILIVFGSVIAYLGVYATNKASDQKNEEITRLTQELNFYAIGKDSFVWLEIVDFGTPDATVNVKHSGEYPVRDIEFLIFNISEQMPLAKTGEISNFDLNEQVADIDVHVIHPGWDKRLSRVPFETSPRKDYYSYLINIDSHSERQRQIVEFQRIDGVWRQWTRIQRRNAAGTFETRIEHIDPEFLMAQPEFRKLIEKISGRANQDSPPEDSP
jgi:hypothetical protein|tara:strand:+ start:3806 stop:4504 length:699 start_codon:yes stop_codon:yes gene_type:complete